MNSFTKFKYFLKILGWFKIPMIGFVSPKLITLNNDTVRVQIDLKRKTKNHFNSMYFGALAVGADLTSGIHAFYFSQELGYKISFAFKGMQAEFLKRAESDVIFETNDPSDPFYSVPMTVNVVSEPDMDLSTNSISYGNIYDTAPYVDSIVVENNGCTDLSITNISSNNAHFVPGWTTQTIAAGSSALLPVTFTATTPGTENGILTFSNNDSIQLVTMQANVVFAPVADYQYTVQNSCTGLVSFSNESTNGDQYFWAFGDGLFSAAVNPSHTYERPGIYNVMLVTTNSGGSDTTYKSVTLNDILYVDFEFPVTVQAGQVTQFIDSSMYPVSWNWFFGDGNNSTTPNPQHTYANQGTFIVTLLAENSAGCTGSENKQIVVQSGIGIEERAPEDLVIYPVPTAGRLNIETSATVEKLSLYTLTGRLIMEVQNNRSLDLSSLPAGSYMLRIAGPRWVINRTVEVVK